MERMAKRAARLLAITVLGVPGFALAQAAGPGDVAQRLARMEQEVAALRAELARRAEPSKAAPVPVAEGMRSGATTIRLGGFIKTVASNSRFSDGEVATNTLGRDFYLPQAIPTGGGAASRVQDFSAKQSRLWLNLSSEVAGHALKAYLETDFQTAAGSQGSQRTTNGYDLALRRAYLQLDRLTIGQDWTTFQFVGALPESTDFVGATEGTVFVRQPQIRYSMPLGSGLTLHAAIENAESGTAVQGAPALIEQGDDRLPDVALRLAWAGGFGEVSLAALVREVRVVDAGVATSRPGWGVSGAGRIILSAAKTSDLRFMATYGRNIGRYVGLNFAPDAVVRPGSAGLGDVGVLAGLAALRVGLTPALRANLIGSVQRVDYADALPSASLAAFNRTAWSVAANLFWSPVKQVDLGIELRHAERELVGGARGQLDRVEFAAKYGF